MKVMTPQTIEAVSDVVCDLCGGSTTKGNGYTPEFATLLRTVRLYPRPFGGEGLRGILLSTDSTLKCDTRLCSLKVFTKHNLRLPEPETLTGP